MITFLLEPLLFLTVVVVLDVSKNMVVHLESSDQTVNPKYLRLHLVVLRSKFKVTH